MRLFGNSVQIVQRTVNQTARTRIARNRRDECIGAGRDDQLVIGGFAALRINNALTPAIDGGNLTAAAQFDAAGGKNPALTSDNDSAVRPEK